MKEIKQSIFRAYDIRGLVDVDFDPEWVERLGQALGAYFLDRGSQRAVVGHDCRASSPIYQAKLAAGLTSCGVDVVLINQVTSPMFYFAAKKLGFPAGVMVTASHNPSEFNGFKIWGGDTTIHSAEITKVYDLMFKGVFPAGQGLVSEHDIAPTYLEELSSQFNFKNKPKVVVDGGNGTGGLITAELLRRSGAEAVELYCQPDGNFPNHHPDPVLHENVRDLAAKVLDAGAACGIGLDGDCDRIGVVNEKGELMYGDQILAIFSRRVLECKPGATIIGEVKCSGLMYDDVKKHGGNPVMGATGHSLIKALMREKGAALAGEMSGHMFFADRYYGFDDASYAALRLVEILDSAPGKPLSSLLSDWPKTFNTPEIRFDCPDAIKFAVVKKAQDYFRSKYEMIDVDGVRVCFPDGWGLLRASNTQPVLVLRFEANSPERLTEIRALVEEPLNAWIAELS